MRSRRNHHPSPPNERPRGRYYSHRSQVEDRRQGRPLRSLSPLHGLGRSHRDYARGFDERFTHRDSPSMDYHRKYQMQESGNLSGEVSTSSKYLSSFEHTNSRIIRQNDSLDGRTSALDGRGLTVTIPANDIPTLHSGKTRGNFSSSSSGNLNEDRQYREHLNLTKIPSREYYKQEVNRMYSSRDVSYPMVPMSQSRGVQSISSSLQKEKSPGPTDIQLPLPSDGLCKSNIMSPDLFRHGEYSGAPAFESARDPKDTIYSRGTLHSSRGEHQDYGYHEIGRRDTDDLAYSSDELYRKLQPSTQGDNENQVSNRKHSMDLDVDTVNDTKRSNRRLTEGNLWDHQSLCEEPVPSYLNMNRQSVTGRRVESLSTGSKYLEFGARVSGDPESSHARGGSGFGTEVGLGSYKERSRSPPRPEHNPDIYELDMSSQRSMKAEEEDNYNLSDRIPKREYSMDEEMSWHDHANALSSREDICRKVPDFTDTNEDWVAEEPHALPSSKASAFSRLGYKKTKRSYDERASPRVSVSQRLSSPGQGFATKNHILNGQKLSIKKRLRPALVCVDGPNHLNMRQDFQKTDKSRKRGLDDQQGGVNEDNDVTSEGKALPVKDDPPKGSEELKQLVDKAFLRFSKHLNETSAQRRRYKEQGKAGTLRCSVCGSHSKEFVDTCSLVSHSFYSLKARLRADHLGFHKALCVLMGWNSDVVTGNTWVLRVLPDEEVLALKANLILWPPLVIIHNSSIGNKNPDEQKVVTVEGMEAILRDIGFSMGTTKVCRGKPANQSIMVVKFMPTFSGLQEAERLHKHYAENKHGREAFQQISSNNSNNDESKGARVDKLELVLYGYLGISDDLDKLEIETKKRCVVKSKKDIQTIANAPLKTE